MQPKHTRTLSLCSRQMDTGKRWVNLPPKLLIISYCSVPKNRPNYVDSQSHKKYL